MILAASVTFILATSSEITDFNGDDDCQNAQAKADQADGEEQVREMNQRFDV